MTSSVCFEDLDVVLTTLVLLSLAVLLLNRLSFSIMALAWFRLA
jgi:hypothetical protein